MKSVIPVAMVCVAPSLVEDASLSSLQEWPTLTEHVESALGNASGAFVGTLEFFDVQSLSANVVEVSCQIMPGETVWGRPRHEPIPLGRGVLLRHGGSGRGSDFLWSAYASTIDKGVRTFSVLVVYREDAGKTEVLHVINSERKGASDAKASFLTIQEFERRQDGEDTRKALQEAAIDVASPELLWSYALRRLFRLEQNPDRRFEAVFSEPLQNARNGRRLWYAAHLLITNGFSWATVTATTEQHYDNGHLRQELLHWGRGGPTDGRLIRERFLEAFEQAPNAETANAALMALLQDDFATHVDWTDAEIAQRRSRLTAACNKPTHKIHELDETRAKNVQDILRAHFDVIVRIGRADGESTGRD